MLFYLDLSEGEGLAVISPFSSFTPPLPPCALSREASLRSGRPLSELANSGSKYGEPRKLSRLVSQKKRRFVFAHQASDFFSPKSVFSEISLFFRDDIFSGHHQYKENSAVNIESTY